ncbi:MAG: IS91 family transposase [Proteobacteria bacterium]|nr:IS91 family transposase [Pseudomonadota bacterium]
MRSPEKISSRPRLEVADIFQAYGDHFRKTHRLTSKQHSVMRDIEQCRTGELGYHVDICSSCGHEEHAYNSCRDRHCPKCQGVARRQWIQSRLSDLLPVLYYHVVFTLPHKLHPVGKYNREKIYDLLFAAASETLLQFGRDPKHLGAEVGFFGILHTWGGKLWDHFHLHFVVPGGGLTVDDQWVEPKYKGKFLFPVQAMSLVFRGKFIEGLKSLYAAGELEIPEEMKHLKKSEQFEKWLNVLVARNWVVYAKKPFSTPEKVVRYVGRYTHKVAISNNRIIAMDDGKVRFNFRNYRNKGKWEETSLAIDEFIRRFLFHVLPKGFHRIRHYGFMANGRCKANLEKIRTLLQAKTPEEKPQETERIKCQKCMKGEMLPMKVITPFKTIILRPWWLLGVDACPG